MYAIWPKQELIDRIRKLEDENQHLRECQVLVDCLPILINRLKDLNEYESLAAWDKARAMLESEEKR